MEFAGWFLNNSASSKLVIHVRFDQPRSYLFCHQRSIAQATCGGNLFSGADTRRRLVSVWSAGHVSCLVIFSGLQQRPGKARVLVGRCNGRDVVMSPADQLTQPTVRAIWSRSREFDHRAPTMNKQRSKVDIAALADAEQLRLAAAGVLLWHEANPGRELSCVLEVRRIACTGHQRARSHGADARDRFQPTTDFAAAMPQLDLAFELAHLAVEFLQMLQQSVNENLPGSTLLASSISSGTRS